MNDKSLQTVQSTAISSLQDLTEIAKKLKGTLTVNKLWNENDLVSIMLLGRDLGLPASTALSHIMIINDKPCLDVPMQQALLMKAGVIFEIVEDATPLYMYVDIESLAVDEKGEKYYKLMYNNDELKAEDKLNKARYKRSAEPYDYRTTAKATRYYKIPNGYKEVVTIRSYNYTSAVSAGLSEKANWKHIKAMLWHRAVGLVIDIVGQDITNNIHNPFEMDINYGLNTIQIAPTDNTEYTETVESDISEVPVTDDNKNPNQLELNLE